LPFHIHLPDSEQAYLDNLPLSATAKERLNQFIGDFIANVSDEFRADPINRRGPNPHYFVVQHVLLDVWGDNAVHTVDFHIQDDRAEFGVLLIGFIDHHP
jgi:hypothetical protein